MQISFYYWFVIVFSIVIFILNPVRPFFTLADSYFIDCFAKKSKCIVNFVRNDTVDTLEVLTGRIQALITSGYLFKQNFVLVFDCRTEMAYHDRSSS
jgi:hypothetical protein